MLQIMKRQTSDYALRAYDYELLRYSSPATLSYARDYVWIHKKKTFFLYFPQTTVLSQYHLLINTQEMYGYAPLVA